jgi:hypothetical protein
VFGIVDILKSSEQDSTCTFLFSTQHINEIDKLVVVHGNVSCSVTVDPVPPENDANLTNCPITLNDIKSCIAMYRSLPNPALSLEYTFGICGCSSEAFIWLDLLSKIKCDTKSKILTYSELSESSVYKDTLEETRRKQNITQDLTDIKDDVLDFFIDIDQNRIKYQNEKMFHIHGS